MSNTASSDPFTETPQAPNQNSSHARPQTGFPNPDMTNRPNANTTDFAQQFQSSYPAYPSATPQYNPNMPYGSYGASYSPYNTPYGGTYGNNYASGYTPGYNPGYNYNVTRQNYSTAGQIANGARETSAMVLSGMHDAMSRFARVSSMIEDVLRNLHMLFDAVFGLGYSLGAFRQEARMWLAIKTGPVGFVARVLKRASNVWRLLCLFFMSPMAGRFSPVALVLRILGLVPEEDPLEVTLVDLWRQREGDGGEEGGLDGVLGDSSSL